jgi:hypothetical protein
MIVCVPHAEFPLASESGPPETAPTIAALALSNARLPAMIPRPAALIPEEELPRASLPRAS